MTQKPTPQILVSTDDVPTVSDDVPCVQQLTPLSLPTRPHDSNADEIINRIQDNIYILKYSFSDNGRIRDAAIHCTILQGQIAVVVWHFVEYVRFHHEYYQIDMMDDELPDSFYDALTSKLELIRPSPLTDSKEIVLNVDVDNFLKHARTFKYDGYQSFTDCAFVFLGVSVPTHKNISRYLLRDNELETLKSIWIKRISINKRTKCLETVIGPTVYKYRSTNTYPLEIDDGNMVMISNWFLYRAPNALGLCSAPIIAIDPSLPRKLIGFHTGDFGDNSSSVAAHITCEMLQSYLSYLSSVLPPPANVRAQMSFSDVELKSPPRPNNCFRNEMVFPVATYSYKAVIAKESQIQPSLIHAQLVKPIAFPAKLKNFVNESGVFVNVLKNSVSKQFNTSCHIPQCDLDVASYECNRIFDELFANEQPRILTHEETIVGGLDGLNPIPRSTSPGYPYLAQSRNSSGKHPWLGSGDNYILDDKFLLSEIANYCEKALAFQRTIQPYTVQLKDETRDPERVKLGKTRTFTASNLTLTYLLRKYFGTIAAKSLTHGKYIGMLPGINPHGNDTNIIVDYCQRISQLNLPNFCAGDFSNFDGTLNERILAIILDTWISRLKLNHDDLKIASVLTLDVFNALLLIDDQIVMNTHSLPSGCPMTTILNTWYNKIIASMVMHRIVKRNCRNLLPRYRQLYGLIAYGDDNVFIISPELRKFIEPDEITKEMSAFGMTYTSGNKHDVIHYEYFSDIAILKRKFLYESRLGRWIMPLDLKVILEVMNWDRCKNEHDKHDQLKMNLDFLSLELVYHGKSTWTEWMNKAIALVSPLVPNLPFYSYEASIEKTIDVDFSF